jgi:DNA-binding NtrC family response regulator
MMPHTSAQSSRSTILLVDTRLAALRQTAELIRGDGHDVIEAASFDSAKRALVAQRPALLISSLKLAAFNGLHLVHFGRLAQPDLNAIIIFQRADAVLQAEAEQVGASFLVEPVQTEALLALVARMVETETLAPAHAPPRLERRRGDRRHLLASDSSLDRRTCERRAAAPIAPTPERRNDVRDV